MEDWTKKAVIAVESKETGHIMIYIAAAGVLVIFIVALVTFLISRIGSGENVHRSRVYRSRVIGSNERRTLGH